MYGAFYSSGSMIYDNGTWLQARLCHSQYSIHCIIVRYNDMYSFSALYCFSGTVKYYRPMRFEDFRLFRTAVPYLYCFAFGQ